MLWNDVEALHSGVVLVLGTGDHMSMNDRQFRDRAVTILHNMARERVSWWQSLIRGRWPIHHEPLRNDAANLLRDAGDNYFVPTGERHVGDN